MRLGRERPLDAPELDCLRFLLPPGILAAAARRAAHAGVTAERSLIVAGLISEEDYLRCLAAWLRLPFEPLDDLPDDAAALPDEMTIDALGSGVLPLIIDRRQVLVVAPRGYALRRMIALLHPRSDMRGRVRITSPERIKRFALRDRGAALGRHASERLLRHAPAFCAAWQGPWRPERATVAGATACAIGTAAWPYAAIAAAQMAMTAVFLGWTVLRGWAVLTPLPQADPGALHRVPDELLPTYSIVVALYDEARVLSELAAALADFDYPAEKLEFKLVLEADDLATRLAAAMLDLDDRFEIVIAPTAGPRTKPKALNAALPFVRGAYTAVFDAEDRPDRDQLRRAFNVFLANDDDLACVQAALVIDNASESALTRLFAAEYAGLFDVLLPGLVALRLPIPLGGSSNHFPTAVLRETGAWDPYNVTEDADLGIRLARNGYRSAMVASSTREEAPAALMPWIRQRTRWFKGWMQTYLVHMRSPARLFTNLGWRGFLAFQLVVGGATLAALAQPVLLGLVLAALFADVPMLTGGGSWVASAIVAVHGLSLICGYATSAVLAFMGLRRRHHLRHVWVIALLPMHWALLSVAAWRAFFQLIVAPQRWEKTPHGARNLRRRPPPSPITDSTDRLDRRDAR